MTFFIIMTPVIYALGVRFPRDRTQIIKLQIKINTISIQITICHTNNIKLMKQPANFNKISRLFD